MAASSSVSTSTGNLVVDGREETKGRNRPAGPGLAEKDGHRLVLEDLDAVLDELPLASSWAPGRPARWPDPSTLEEIRRRGIDVDVYRTDEAVRRYAEADPATAAAALHLTC